jgi:hypothetical protein
VLIVAELAGSAISIDKNILHDRVRKNHNFKNYLHMEKELVLQKLALLMSDDHFNNNLISFCKKEIKGFTNETLSYDGKYDVFNKREEDDSLGQYIVFYMKEKTVCPYVEITFDLKKFVTAFDTFPSLLRKKNFHAKVVNLFIGIKKKYIFKQNYQKIS